VPQVCGFVNSGRARPEDRAALEAWVAARYPLGNHTAHHTQLETVGLTQLETVGLDAYLADVDAGEPLLAKLLDPGKERVWRYSDAP